METLKAAKYDTGKPMISLVSQDFLRIVWGAANPACDALCAIQYLAEPMEDKDKVHEFHDRLRGAIMKLAKIKGTRFMLEQCAVAMGPLGGMKKYSRNNWRLGLGILRMIDAACRHMLAYCCGEEFDEETTASHIGCACFALQCIANEMWGDAFNEVSALSDTSTWKIPNEK